MVEALQKEKVIMLKGKDRLEKIVLKKKKKHGKKKSIFSRY